MQVSRRSHSWTSWDRSEIQVWLLEQGADPQQADEDDVTPCMAAARNNNVLSVMRLVNKPCEYGQWQDMQ